MPYYPIFLELRNRPVLVIGGGPVATQKAKMLVRAGAQVTVVSPAVGVSLQRLVREKKIRWRKGRFETRHLQGMELVVAATDDEIVNKQASRACRNRGIWINVVDHPKLCSFIVPSVVRRGKLVLAISTSGVSPALSKWIRKDLEKRYGTELGKLLQKAARVRGLVQETLPSYARRKRLYERAMKAYFDIIREAIR